MGLVGSTERTFGVLCADILLTIIIYIFNL